MNFKKISPFLFAIVFIFTTTSCKLPDFNPSPISSEPSSSETSPAGVRNPLTGLYDLPDDAKNLRPLAVMINNLGVAQSVQSGIGSADVVYETLVEGGITRLMAMFSNPENAPELGSVRSARYAFVELAYGHDALYVHAGGDPTYAIPFMREIGVGFDIDSSYSAAGHRVQNGLASEHTLFTSGEDLKSVLLEEDIRLELENEYQNMFMDFANEDEPVTLADDTANDIHVPFSDDYYSDYEYDEATKTYLKSQCGEPHTDMNNQKQVSVKNIFVLFTNIGFYPDGAHMSIDLSSGDGYYFSNGGYEQIKWTKGESNNRLSFTKADGSVLQVNPGNSWISITSLDEQSNFIFS